MNSFLNNIEGKGAIMKQRILGLCINDGDFSIAELSKELNASIPTVTRLIGELIEDGFLEDLGKTGTSGGRRPSIFGCRVFCRDGHPQAPRQHSRDQLQGQDR